MRPETRDPVSKGKEGVDVTRQLPKLEVLKGKEQEIFLRIDLNGHTHTHEGKKKRL